MQVLQDHRERNQGNLIDEQIIISFKYATHFHQKRCLSIDSFHVANCVTQHICNHGNRYKRVILVTCTIENFSYCTGIIGYSIYTIDYELSGFLKTGKTMIRRL